MKFNQKLTAATLSLALMTTAVNSSAGGVPVVDVGAIAQAITQVENQVKQIEQLQTQVLDIKDTSNLGELFGNQLVREQLNKYLPSGYTDVLQAASNGDLGALQQVANLAKQREKQAQTKQSGVERQAAAKLLQSASHIQNANMLSEMNTELRSLVNQLDTAKTTAQKQDLLNALTAKQASISLQLGQMQMQRAQLEHEEKLANRQAVNEYWGKRLQ